MSLVDEFEGHIGDLVRFSHPDKVSLVGYVRGYSHKKVKLSNMGYETPSGEPRDTSWLRYYPGHEERYSTKLDMWESYEILKSANVKEE